MTPLTYLDDSILCRMVLHPYEMVLLGYGMVPYPFRMISYAYEMVSHLIKVQNFDVFDIMAFLNSNFLSFPLSR
jgi:hypothetical protein